ncbi:MAG: hypothetical protein K2O18_00275 [Oscillospiraceae bacterium]|nr:hypothetical protein [Oscillospiraceae bacterium]
MNFSNTRLYFCVGFYPDGSYVTNTVREEDLQNNIEYNKCNRPGRFYFVDGEYVCGGMLDADAKDEFIEKCKARMKELKPQPYDTRPYI